MICANCGSIDFGWSKFPRKDTIIIRCKRCNEREAVSK